ncbi:hypothetical protein [Halioxenophilus sp. WMMB6]|uniref:3'-5' exonuclease n=1 Tax=Halioxenophilus sp. WMMB6 TaxID=3073815 RepID=UPI00295F2B41|nr:hypothetical protein [Halioxenophilus sp. WMMB6]
MTIHKPQPNRRRTASMQSITNLPITPGGSRLRPQVIDIEASGFGAYSYPIEIGVVMSNGLRFSRLIKPMPDWIHWDPEAEALHGISQRQLQRHGHSAFEVAGELNQLLLGQTVYTDAWVVDKPWLDTLFNRVAMERKFFISPIESIISEHQMEQWVPAKRQLSPQMGNREHRALDDAVLIQETYVLTRMQQAGGQKSRSRKNGG